MDDDEEWHEPAAARDRNHRDDLPYLQPRRGNAGSTGQALEGLDEVDRAFLAQGGGDRQRKPRKSSGKPVVRTYQRVRGLGTGYANLSSEQAAYMQSSMLYGNSVPPQQAMAQWQYMMNMQQQQQQQQQLQQQQHLQQQEDLAPLPTVTSSSSSSSLSSPPSLEAPHYELTSEEEAIVLFSLHLRRLNFFT